MSLPSRLASAWRNLIHRNRLERELDEELRASLEVLVAGSVGAVGLLLRRATRIGAMDALRYE